jgi:hypothetical protein
MVNVEGLALVMKSKGTRALCGLRNFLFLTPQSPPDIVDELEISLSPHQKIS